MPGPVISITGSTVISDPDRLRALRQRLDGSLGREIVASGKPLLIEDARREPLLIDHLAVREGYVVAYAGFPLTDQHGHTIGTLATWDTRPRRWTSGHTQVMRDFVMMIRARIFGIAPA